MPFLVTNNTMMKHLLKLILMIPALLFAQPGFAVGCTGNIVSGVLTTESGILVYMNSDDWNDANPGDPSAFGFDTYYDTADPLTPWSGQAWTAFPDGSNALGFITFDGMTGTFESIGGSSTWGGTESSVDMTPISFSDPSFSGSATHKTLTGGGPDDVADWFVGLGDIDFSGATLTAEEGDGCPAGDINLFINGTPSYMASSCPLTSINLTWTSSSVSGCETGGGDWSGPGSRAAENLAGESASVSIPDAGTMIFTLTCLEDITGATITGGAIVGCTDPVDGGPGGPGGDPGTIVPDYIQT